MNEFTIGDLVLVSRIITYTPPEGYRKYLGVIGCVIHTDTIDDEPVYILDSTEDCLWYGNELEYAATEIDTTNIGGLL